jgi:hypothetical protein
MKKVSKLNERQMSEINKSKVPDCLMNSKVKVSKKTFKIDFTSSVS